MRGGPKDEREREDGKFCEAQHKGFTSSPNYLKQ